VTREALPALLAAHEPADAEEAADLERMRVWAEPALSRALRKALG
jgi:hypothetical protein